MPRHSLPDFRKAERCASDRVTVPCPEAEAVRGRKQWAMPLAGGRSGPCLLRGLPRGHGGRPGPRRRLAGCLEGACERRRAVPPSGGGPEQPAKAGEGRRRGWCQPGDEQPAACAPGRRARERALRLDGADAALLGWSGPTSGGGGGGGGASWPGLPSGCPAGAGEAEGDAAATGRAASMERLAAALGRVAWSPGPPLPLDLIVAKCRLPALVRPGPDRHCGFSLDPVEFVDW
uniref:Uncharacterized protein n=1 Tax=Sphaerodactylus townsendi TaxID=933632 RepID=A0ACB8G8U9_9SAUR